MKSLHLVFCSAILLQLLFLLSVQADVRLPAIISDHMVLQKSEKTAIWGWAAPSEQVTVTLDTQLAKTIADANGKWKVTFNLSQSSAGPFQMTVAGKNQIVISDVLVGQVWLASGQSNMAFKLKDSLGGGDEIAHSTNPLLRQFLETHNQLPQPADDCPGTWTLAGPSTSGDFSGVAYYFGKKLQNELKVPVALLNASVPSTTSEQWTSDEGLDVDPELKAVKDLTHQCWTTFTDERKKYPDLFQHWLEQYQRTDKPIGNPADFAGMDVPATGWTKITLPGSVTGAGLPAAGAFWLRKEFTLTADEFKVFSQRTILSYSAGANDYETVYLNGEKVSESLPKDRGEILDYRQVACDLPPKLIKEGGNVLAIRFFSPVQVPQLGGGLNLPGLLNLATPPIAGDWLAKTEYALAPLDPAAMAAVPPDPYLPFAANLPKANEPCYCFNGMIAPVLPYAIKGVIWYQGEQDADHAVQYQTAFGLLIKDWRAKWGLGDFPFYFCQLPGLGDSHTPPAENPWAEQRESQRLTLQLPNTGMAVLIDVGNPGNLHPQDKTDPGERLALIALAKTYQENIPYSGPMFESSKVEDDKIRVTFQHTDGGLVAKPLKDEAKIYYTYDPNKVPPVPTSPKSDLQGFAICGPDHKWVWADAKIDGTTVIVWSEQVPQPVAIRYAWDGSPICNLYNEANLPASPFRTDDFPLSTADARYGK